MTPRSVLYTANGTCVVFAFDFPLFEDTELNVLIDGVLQTSGYTLLGDCFHSGGAIAFASAPASGRIITLRRAGKVQVSESDTTGFLADKIVAGDNITITRSSDSDGQHLTIAASANSGDVLLKSHNLADLPDTAQARINLGLGTAATLNVGSAANQLVQLDANAKLPALDGSQLTNIPVGKVQTDGTDSAGYLQDKLAAGANIAVTKVADKMSVAVTGLGNTAALNLDTDGTLAANSDSLVPSEKAVKTYVDARIDAVTTTVTTLAGTIDNTPDIGQLYLAVARLDTPTSPNLGGTQVADEFDSASGIESLGDATVAGGYLGNPGGVLLIDRTSGTIIAGPVESGYGTAAASFDGATQAYTACPRFNSPSAAYIGKDYGSTPQRIVQGIFYGPSDRYIVSSPTNATITLEASQDSSSWTALGSTSTGTASATILTIPSSDTTTFWRYVRFRGSNIGAGEVMYCAEAQFYSLETSANITTVSNAYTALSAPSAISLVAEYQDLSVSNTATLNTDITFEVSRDAGTTWTPVTMSDFGPSAIAGARVLKGSADVSAQPSGTRIKWRIKTFNAREQRVHGLWMQWK